MSRGPGQYQLMIIRILNGDIRKSPLPDGWWPMDTLGRCVGLITTESITGKPNRAELRRAIRSLERSGHVEVRREQELLDEDGRHRGHVQNVVKLTSKGQEAYCCRQSFRADVSHWRDLLPLAAYGQLP